MHHVEGGGVGVGGSVCDLVGWGVDGAWSCRLHTCSKASAAHRPMALETN